MNNENTKVKCSYGVPILNPLPEKFTFRNRYNNNTKRNLKISCN